MIGANYATFCPEVCRFWGSRRMLLLFEVASGEKEFVTYEGSIATVVCPFVVWVIEMGVLAGVPRVGRTTCCFKVSLRTSAWIMGWEL